jgi:hypothetical protein
MMGKFANKPLLASVFIVFATSTVAAAPTPIVHAVFTADDATHHIAMKKVRAKRQQTAPVPPDNPGYLKGTNIPSRVEAPAPGSH